MARHGRSKDHVARALLAEDLSSNARTVVSTREVNVHHTVPVFKTVVETTRLGGDSGVGNHHVQTPEVSNNRLGSSLDLYNIMVSGQ